MTTSTQPARSLGIMTLILPGPTTKRALSLYLFRVTYRNPCPEERGCVMTWDVIGGRLPYQIAAERLSSGELRWHCTCADAVYCGERDPHHVCKHVHGLLETMPPITNPVARRNRQAA